MGGAIINTKYGVIGVLYGRKEGVDKSVNLAISINSIKPILASIFESGKVTRGWIGLYLQPITPELAKAFGLTNKDGAFVAEVKPDSPAQKAGFQKGDIIVSFGEIKIKSVQELQGLIAHSPPGHKMQVEIIRKRRNVKIEVEIGEKLL